jgi:hypothetical protein
MNIGKLLGTIVKVAKANPTLVISAVSAIGPVVKAIKAETKKRPA